MSALNELIDRIRSDDTAAYLPFETTEQLEEQIVGDLATLLAERFDAARGAVVAGAPEVEPDLAARVPSAFSRIIGRERELGEVLDLVGSGDHRVITLLGPGGIGKSRLAIETAAAAEHLFPDGTAFIALENVLEPGLLLPTIAYGLGIRDAGERTLEDRLAIALSGRRMLIVLDNFEQIVDAAPQIVALYSLAPEATFLVTSRILLRIRGERVYEVPPLATADAAAPHSVTRAAAAPAVELFVERARAVKPDFALTPSNTAAVVAVCQALDGLPLAIELAAARMRLLTPAGVLQRLDGRLRLLVDASRDLPERQRTLRATIQWSTGLLRENERALLRDLGVFSAGFTLEAVESIGAGRSWEPDAVEALEALVDSSLVSQSDVDGEAVFSMLVTVREYALEQLVDLGEERIMRDAHARYIDDLTRRVAPELEGAGQRDAARRLDLERGNLRTAMRHLVDIGTADLGTDIAWRLYLYWWLRGFFNEVGLWMKELLERVPDASPHARAVALFFYLWSSMWTTQKRGEVVAGLKESAELFAVSEDDFGKSMADATRGFALIALGQADDDVVALFDGLRASGRPWAEALAMIALGRVSLSQGRWDEAVGRFEEGLAAAESGGDLFTQTVTRHHLARLRLISGDADAAAHGFADAMRISMAIEHEEGIAYAIEGLCAVAALRGDVEIAATLAGAAEMTRQRITMFDAEQFVYHRRFLDEATTPANEALVREAMGHGRDMSALEAAEFALANVDADG